MAYEGKKDYFSSCMINPVGEQKKTEGIIMPVYTEILKKKIH